MKLRVFLLGLLAFVLALLVVFPARWLAHGLPASIQCRQWRGSLWQGGCDGVQVAQPGTGAFELETLRWHVHPATLLRLRLEADFSTTYLQGDAKGLLAVGRGGALEVRNVSARALLDRALFGALPAGWRGRLEIAQLALGLQGRTLRQLAGELQLQDLDDGRGNALGSYRLVFPAAGTAPFTGQLQDAGGPFEVRAEVKITGERAWTLDGTVLPRAGASAAYTRHLELLGPADAGGRYRISAAGTFD
jgi:hypothetical protein